MPIPGEVRRQLALLCRRGPCRFVARNYPCDWHPTTVENLTSGMPYTDQTAFEAVADALDNPGIEVNAVTLRIPEGKTGYEFLIPQGQGCAPVYVKLQLGAGCVLARSFHYSDYAERQP